MLTPLVGMPHITNATPIVPVQMLFASRSTPLLAERLSTTLCDGVSSSWLETQAAHWRCRSQPKPRSTSAAFIVAVSLSMASMSLHPATGSVAIHRRQRRLRLTCLTLELFFIASAQEDQYHHGSSR